MRARAAVPGLVALARASRRAARAYGCSTLAAARRARRARVEGAWTYSEALAYGILDPAMRPDERERIYSTHRREALQNRLNPHRLAALSEDKLAFHRYMTALGVPCPELYGVVGRPSGWTAAGGGPGGADAFCRMLVREAAGGVVIKPVMGYLGLGLHLLARGPQGLRDHGGQPVDPRELHARLLADEEFDLFIVQERLRNHPELDAINPSSALQTLRIVTLVRDDGGVAVLYACLKLALGAAAVDNFRSGQTGNGEAEVDLESGLLGPVLTAAPDGVGYVAHSAVPTTGEPLAGRPAPLLAEALEVAVAAAPHLLPMRTLGWDIALTPRGAVVIEANDFWGTAYLPLSPDAHALLAAAAGIGGNGPPDGLIEDGTRSTRVGLDVW